MLMRWLCFLLPAALCFPALATPSADEIVAKVVARDKQLVQRRKAYDYDLDITREKLDENRAVVSSGLSGGEDVIVGGQVRVQDGLTVDPRRDAKS